MKNIDIINDEIKTNKTIIRNTDNQTTISSLKAENEALRDEIVIEEELALEADMLEINNREIPELFHTISIEEQEKLEMEDFDHDMQEAYDRYSVSPTDKDREDMYNWELKKDSNPFINDYPILKPNRFENVMDDLFDRHTLTDKYGIKDDDEYDKEILDDMLEATPNWTPQDYDQQRTVDDRVQTNLDKIIWRECTTAYGGIKKLDPSVGGECKIPSHLRNENIATFTQVSNEQWPGVNDGKSEAEIISKIYRIIEADFNTVIMLNKAIRERECLNPWDAVINDDGLTLLQLAESMKEVALNIEPANTEEGQAIIIESLDDLETAIYKVNPEWIDSRVDFNIASKVPRDWKPPVQEFEQTNNVGEYTYHSLHKIPKSEHLNTENVRTFTKAINFLEKNTFKIETLDKLQSWAWDILNWDQQAVFNKTVQTAMQERARAQA